MKNELVEKIKEYFAGKSKEEILRDWEEIKTFRSSNEILLDDYMALIDPNEFDEYRNIGLEPKRVDYSTSYQEESNFKKENPTLVQVGNSGLSFMQASYMTFLLHEPPYRSLDHESASMDCYQVFRDNNELVFAEAG